MSSSPYELGCIAFNGVYERPVVDAVGAVVSFIIFFIIGIIIAIILLKFCGTRWFGDRFKKPTDEETQIISPLNPDDEPVVKKNPTKKRFRRNRAIDFDRDEPKVPLIPPILEILDLHDPTKTVVQEEKTIADAIIQTTEEGGDMTLLQQDVLSTSTVEDKGRMSRILVMGTLELLQSNGLLQSGRVDREQHNFLVAEINEGAKSSRDQLEMRSKLSEEELRNNAELKKDEALLKKKLDELPSNMNHILSEVMSNEEKRYKASLIMRAGLSEDETNLLLTALANDLAAYESNVANQQERQLSLLDERLAERRRLLAAAQNQSEQDKEEINGRVIARRGQLENLAEKLGEKERAALLTRYTDEMKAAQEAHENNLKEQQAGLAERLRQRRADKVQQLEQNQVEARIGLFNKLTQTKGQDFLKRYQDLLVLQVEENESLRDQLDKDDYSQFDKLRHDNLQLREAQITEVEVTFMTDLKTALPSMTQEEADRIMAQHNQNMYTWQRSEKIARRENQSRLEDRLEALKKQREDERITAANEQVAIEERQKRVINKALSLSVDLDEAAKERILAEHRSNITSLSNQSQMNRARQSKMLEHKIAQRKAQNAEVQLPQKKAIFDSKIRQNPDLPKLEEALSKRVTEDQVLIEDDRKARLTELHEILTKETQGILECQDKHLSQLIGRLQVGQVRRQKVIANQDKIILELESKVEKTVFSEDREGRVSNPALDQLLQKHKNSVAALTDQQEDDRSRSEAEVEQKLDQSRRKKKRELDAKFEAEERDTRQRFVDSKIGSVTQTMIENTLVRQHDQALDEIEDDFRLEMLRQKESLIHKQDLELQKMLQDQRKNFLVQLAQMSQLSKKEIDAVVASTAANVGMNAKDERSLAKDFKGEMSRLGRVADDDDEDDDLDSDARRPRKKGSNARPGSGGSSDQDHSRPSAKKSKKFPPPRRPSSRTQVPTFIPEEDEEDLSY